MGSTPGQSVFGHLKPRYNFRKVCRIFNVHEDTLKAWLRDGVPLANGKRIRLRYVPLGPKKKEFECDEVERVYQEMCASTVEDGDADVLEFPDSRGGRKRAAREESGEGEDLDDIDVTRRRRAS
jgi:hypothetical protein